jgi:gas vesicle protein GvpL/GvpF
VTLVVRSIVRAVDAERVSLPDLIPVHGERIAALASLRTDAPRATEQELREHHAITRAVHESAPSLPSRFGDVFSDEGALASALRAREETLAAELARIGDRVEISVTLRWRVPFANGTTDERASGRAYLAARAARERERRLAEQLVARLVEHLACERAFIRQRICPREGVAAIVALLSTRDEVSTMRQHIGSFAERSTEIVMDVHGPLPPSSFVE